MQLLSTGVANNLVSRVSLDDLTGSSFVEINPKRPDLLCARSLIDSDSVIGIVTSLFLICVLPHGHAGGPVVH